MKPESQDSEFKRRITKKKLLKIAKERMASEEIDAWIVFTREASEDPLAAEFGLSAMIWRSAGIVTPDGNHALVGSFDVKQVERSGIYDEVVGYGSEGAADDLGKIAKKLHLSKVAINESQDFALADGLTSGMRKYLSRYLGRRIKFVSSEDLAIDLRGRLLIEEQDKIRSAIKLTEKILEDAEGNVIKEGVKDAAIFKYIQEKTRDEGANFSWPESMDPSLNVGTTPPQHSAYDNLTLRRGNLFRIDFGIELEGYCSDLQRVYFLGTPPEKLVKDFQVARDACAAAISRLSPDESGYYVDEAGRKVVLEKGFANFAHGLGHTLGRTAHEIGPLLAPRWRKRYGYAMDKKIGRNIVFTIEPTIYSKFGAINIEQDVLVKNNGVVDELSKPMEEIIEIHV